MALFMQRVPCRSVFVRYGSTLGLASVTAASAVSKNAPLAWCEDKKNNAGTEIKIPDVKLPDGFPKLPEKIALPFELPDISKETALPIATSVGFGTVTGFSCGYSLKKVGRAAAGVFGGLFILFQVTWGGGAGRRCRIACVMVPPMLTSLTWVFVAYSIVFRPLIKWAM